MEELYDLKTDPFELENLAGSNKPEHQAALKELQSQLNRWTKATRDQLADKLSRFFYDDDDIEEIRDVAKKYLNNNQRLELEYLPKQQETN